MGILELAQTQPVSIREFGNVTNGGVTDDSGMVFPIAVTSSKEDLHRVNSQVHLHESSIPQQLGPTVEYSRLLQNVAACLGVSATANLGYLQELLDQMCSSISATLAPSERVMRDLSGQIWDSTSIMFALPKKSLQDIGDRIWGSTDTEPSAMLSLELAAERGDEEAFVAAARDVDWEQLTAGDAVYAVRLALQAGAHLCARDLADQGARLYPQNATLVRMARVLAPPQVRRMEPGQSEITRLNRAWLEQNRSEFRMQWVAVHQGHLVAAAPSLVEFRQRLGELYHPIPSDLLVSHVE